MPHGECIASLDNDNTDWAERSDYWLQNVSPEPTYHEKLRKFYHAPLVIGGYGLKLCVDRGTLLIRNGFTHYPQKSEEFRFFPRDRRLPSRIVIVDGHGSITLDVLEWLSIQGVPLIQLNWRGEVLNVGGGQGYAADPELARMQAEIQKGPKGLEIARWLISTKIENCIATVQNVLPTSPATELAVKRLEEKLVDLNRHPPTNIGALLGVEGIAAAAYFKSWYSRPIKWKSTEKQPIPGDWLRIGSRLTTSKSNQFANHPVNAMLNYAYGMLENQVRTKLLAMGFDPHIGFIHSFEWRRPAFIFDLMEPLRPVIDRRILEFVQKHIFTPGDFILNKSGVCKLNPQLARYVVQLAQCGEEIELIMATAIKRLTAGNNTANKRALKNLAVVNGRLAGKRE